jgi:hypothetical protein
MAPISPYFCLYINNFAAYQKEKYSFRRGLPLLRAPCPIAQVGRGLILSQVAGDPAGKVDFPGGGGVNTLNLP